MARVTPQVLLAGSALLVTVLATVPTLLFGGGSWPITTDKQRIVGTSVESYVLPATCATQPLVPDLFHLPDIDPFNPRQASSMPGLMSPPPPPLAPPPLPILPAPVPR